MTDEQFDRLLRDSFDCFGENYFTVTEGLVKKHRFSMHFYWSMWHTRRVKQSASTVSQKRRLTIVMTVMILLSALTLTACGFWSELIGYITHVFEDHTQVKIMQDGDAPETIETYYTVSELPEGYKLSTHFSTPQMSSYVYINENNMTISFLQQTKQVFNYYVNSEGYQVIPVSVLGNPGYVAYVEDECQLVWEANGYVFLVSCNEFLETEQLVLIAESVRNEF